MELHESEVGSGPIFLDQISCDGSETTLLECTEKGAPIKTHQCDHSKDVGLVCQGLFCVPVFPNSQ